MALGVLPCVRTPLRALAAHVHLNSTRRSFECCVQTGGMNGMMPAGAMGGLPNGAMLQQQGGNQMQMLQHAAQMQGMQPMANGGGMQAMNGMQVR